MKREKIERAHPIFYVFIFIGLFALALTIAAPAITKNNILKILIIVFLLVLLMLVLLERLGFFRFIARRTYDGIKTQRGKLFRPFIFDRVGWPPIILLGKSSSHQFIYGTEDGIVFSALTGDKTLHYVDIRIARPSRERWVKKTVFLEMNNGTVFRYDYSTKDEFEEFVDFLEEKNVSIDPALKLGDKQKHIKTAT